MVLARGMFKRAGVRQGPLAGPRSYGSEATTLFARMNTQPDDYWKSAIDSLIRGATADGWWAKMKGFSCLSLHTEQAAYLNWVAGGLYSTLTAYGTYTYRPNYGWAGNGTNTTGAYLGTGVNAVTILSQNDHSIFAYVRTPANGNPVVGIADTSTDRVRLTFINGGNAAARLSDNSTLSVANAATNGLLVGSRTASNVKKIYLAGAEIATAATASATVPTQELCFARSGTTNRSSDEMIFVGCGLGLTASDVANMSARTEAFIAATEPRYFLLTTSGQSNLNRMFIDDASSGSGDSSANSNAAARVLTPALQAFLDAKFTGRPNKLTIINKAVSGAHMLPASGFSSWWDNTTHLPATYATNWQTSVQAVQYLSRHTHVNAHAQGEAEASEPAYLVSDWEAATREFFAWTATIKSGIKTVVQPLARNTDVTSARLKSFRDAQAAWDGVVSNFYMAPDTCDIHRISAADWHAVPYSTGTDGYDRLALELARTTAVAMGCTGVVWRGPEIASAAKSGANTIDVTLTYPTGSGGSDFTPTSGIDGFLVADGSGAKTVTGAVRVSATVIRVTVSGAALSGSVTITYDTMQNGVLAANMVIDNYSFPLPLRVSGAVSAP